MNSHTLGLIAFSYCRALVDLLEPPFQDISGPTGLRVGSSLGEVSQVTPAAFPSGVGEQNPGVIFRAPPCGSFHKCKGPRRSESSGGGPRGLALTMMPTLTFIDSPFPAMIQGLRTPITGPSEDNYLNLWEGGVLLDPLKFGSFLREQGGS